MGGIPGSVWRSWERRGAVEAGCFHHRRSYISPDRKLFQDRSDSKLPIHRRSSLPSLAPWFLSNCAPSPSLRLFVCFLHVILLSTMNPSSSALPKAVSIPSRLLRPSRQYSHQAPTRCIQSMTQSRGYYIAAVPTSRNLRDGVPVKKDPLSLSSRVGCSMPGFFDPTPADLVLWTEFPYHLFTIRGHFRSIQNARSRQECFCWGHQEGILWAGEEIPPGYKQRSQRQGQVCGGSIGI